MLLRPNDCDELHGGARPAAKVNPSMPSNCTSVSRRIPKPVKTTIVAEPALKSNWTPKSTWYRPVRAVIEFVLTLALSIIAAPIVILAAILIKLTSRGPVIYSQARVGLNGRVFQIFKLRSMYHNCESLTGPCWSFGKDQRVTPVGKLLRVTHIDELPQLLNVLRGEMSLIGPRPERPEFIPRLAQSIDRYRERLRVRPGITGFAQVQVPADTDLDSVRRKLPYDLYYIESMGPWLDFRILLCTALKMVGVSFSTMRTIFAMPTPNSTQCNENHDSRASAVAHVQVQTT